MTKQEFKQKCIGLRNQNFTLGEIVKILKRPKTTIYFHVSKVPISKVLKEKIRQINIEKVAKAHPSKGVSLLNRHPTDFKIWNYNLVNLFAHVIFDGEVSRSGIAYNNRSGVLLENFKTNMKSIYSYEPARYINQRTGVVRLGYFSVELSAFAHNKISILLANIATLTRRLQRAFLRAFFDDEGCVYFQSKNNRRQVKGYQYNNKILFLVQKLLKNFQIESKVDSRFHEIIIGRRKNLEQFAKEINFSAGLKINGNRSNSIWKKDLEKREILKMALASYQI